MEMSKFNYVFIIEVIIKGGVVLDHIMKVHFMAEQLHWIAAGVAYKVDITVYSNMLLGQKFSFDLFCFLWDLEIQLTGRKAQIYLYTVHVPTVDRETLTKLKL